MLIPTQITLIVVDGIAPLYPLLMMKPAAPIAFMTW
jgi:hypothetical protein